MVSEACQGGSIAEPHQARQNPLKRPGAKAAYRVVFWLLRWPRYACRAGIDAIAGQLVAAGMRQHVRMHFDTKVGRNAGPFDHAGEAGSRPRRASLRHNTKGD